MTEVPVCPIAIDGIQSLIGAERFRAFMRHVTAAKRALEGRVIWHVNSTARGGGVAEMLRPMIAHMRGLGLDTRWMVVEGNDPFFAVTKRLHNHLHGHAGDGESLDGTAREAYDSTLADNVQMLCEHVGPRDIVICHDPQTAGLVPAVAGQASTVIWRSHIGHEQPNELALRAWDFLLPYVQPAHQWVFSRSAYVPPQLDHAHSTIIAPSIDPLSAKNRPISPDTCQAILMQTGLITGSHTDAEPSFIRHDGTVAHVSRPSDVLREGPPAAVDRRLVVQVSRWDALKDPLGVMRGFARHLSSDSATLILAGPDSAAVADDPEGARTLEDTRAAWRALPDASRRDVHIACLPMDDLEENAAIVNALQRHATVVVQKSLYEGFGLTVTEAMWKARPVVASAVGGIQDQIVSGVHGMLVPDPTDLDRYAYLVQQVLEDDELAHRLGHSAQQRVVDHYLLTRHVVQYLDLFQRLLA